MILPTFKKTITIFNKLDARDNPNREELWIKTVLSNVAWSSSITRTVVGTDTNVGQSMICRIAATPLYKPYEEWIHSNGCFTLRVGDYFVLGTTTETDPRKVKNQKFIARAVKINDFDAFPHYRIEGV